MKIQLPENINQHWLWDDPTKFQWWIQLLKLVGDGDSERTVRGVVCKFGFGEIVTTQGELAKLWGTTTEKAQAFLRKLESKGEIRRKTDAKLTRIFICNIADYDTLGRSFDAKLTQRRKVDAILTELISVISSCSEDDRRSFDAVLTQLANFKRKEPKENIYIQVTSPDGDVQEDKSSCLLTRAESAGVEKKGKSKKTSKPQKERANKNPTIVARARVVFESHFQQLYQNPYYWTAKDGANMKQLLQKISYSRQHRENPLPVDDDSILDALSKFLETINKSWVMDNFSVTTINSQYNNIISEIRNRSKLDTNGRITNTPTTQGRSAIGADISDSYRQRASILADIEEADRRYLERRESVSDVSYEELPALSGGESV